MSAGITQRSEGGIEWRCGLSDGGTPSSEAFDVGGFAIDAGIFSVISAASFTIFVAAAARAFFWLNVS